MPASAKYASSLRPIVGSPPRLEHGNMVARVSLYRSSNRRCASCSPSRFPRMPVIPVRSCSTIRRAK